MKSPRSVRARISRFCSSSTRTPPLFAAGIRPARAGLSTYRREGVTPLKRIYDPIHHFIELSDAETALLDVGPMQRLRRLRQLGLAYVAFPAAEHSRFTHALG